MPEQAIDSASQQKKQPQQMEGEAVDFISKFNQWQRQKEQPATVAAPVVVEAGQKPLIALPEGMTREDMFANRKQALDARLPSYLDYTRFYRPIRPPTKMDALFSGEYAQTDAILLFSDPLLCCRSSIGS